MALESARHHHRIVQHASGTRRQIPVKRQKDKPENGCATGSINGSSRWFRTCPEA